jgi:hypothetical protein
MARPRKDNADYFSHDNNMRNDTKILALRTKFGNKGYAIWNMLLEVLTDAEEFKIELSKLDYELLAGDFRVDTEELKEVVKYLVEIRLLTKEYDAQIYYSENLIKRLKPVMDKRVRAREQSEQQIRQKDGTFGGFSGNNTEQPAVSVSETPQSKVKESKGKESKVKTSEPSSQVQEIFSLFYSTINRNIDFANKTQRKAVEDMIRLQGFDRVKQVTELAIQAYGQQYAPVITTPLQLKDKWAQLGVWLKGKQATKIQDISNL